MGAVAGVVINVKFDILQDELSLSGLVDHAEHPEGGPRNELLELRLLTSPSLRASRSGRPEERLLVDARLSWSSGPEDF